MKAKTTPMIWIIMDSSDTAYTTGTLGTATSTVAYGYNSTYWRDQLTSYNGTTITYDAVGNPLKWRDGMSFTWKAGRQMYTTTMSNGNKYYYEYNDDGIRYKKWKVGGYVTNYYLDGSTIIAEKNSQNTIIYKHDENGRYVGFNLNGTDYYYVYNAQGDVMGIVNASGTIVARYTYDPWGKVIDVRNVAGAIVTSSTHVGNINPIRYRGYYYDAETGLYYLNSRYYDPTVGRFVNADSQLNPDIETGKNLYAYAGDNPVNRSDSTGLWFGLDDLIAGAVGAAVGIGGQLISDLIYGEFSSWEVYVGAGVGGAVGGVISIYCPIAGAAVGSGVSTLLGQSLEKATGKNDRRYGEILLNTAIDTGIGATVGTINLKIPGVTSGRNSMSAVYKSGLTKLGNKTASKMSAKVIAKGILSGIAGDTYVNLVNGSIPGATYWYDGVGTANGGRGNYMCNYNGRIYVVDGIYYGRVYE